MNAQPAQADDAMVEAVAVHWHDMAELPEVRLGTVKTLIVAFETKHGQFTTTYDYLNGYRLVSEDDCLNKDSDIECPCEDGDGCPTTGWYESVPSDEYDRFYTKMHSSNQEVKYLGWAEFPKFKSRAAISAVRKP